MAKTIVHGEINQVFGKLKTLLTQNKCKITAQETPQNLTVIQGSIWGTTAKTAQKKITYTLQQNPAETNITSKACLTSAYINFTVVGCVLSVALLAICGWIAVDLQGYVANGAGFWGWLAQTSGQFDSGKAAVFIRLSWILAAFLVGSLAVEAYIIWKVHSGIGVFAQDMVKALQN